MAMNPMQRKANNSFLLGILITLVITGAIIAFLIYQVMNLNTEIEEIQAHTVNAYIVIDEIKSGTEINSSQVERVELNIDKNVDTSNLYTALPAGEEAVKAKVDLTPGTVLTTDLTYKDEPLASDVRTVEYNVIIPQSKLLTGEYIDIRLRLPNGQDLIVVSHKMITVPEMEDGTLSANSISMELSEDEILTLSCAIVETYQMNGSMLYSVKYVEPGIQEEATPTYIPNDATIALVHNNPNIVEEAKNELINRYNSDVEDSEDTEIIRDTINNAIRGNEDAADNVVEKTEDEITRLQEERELYIESLGG